MLNGSSSRSQNFSQDEFSSSSQQHLPTVGHSISIDEEELANLLKEEVANEEPSDDEQTMDYEQHRGLESDQSPSPVDARLTNINSVELEEELAAAFATEDHSELGPVTPEDMNDSSASLKTAPNSIRSQYQPDCSLEERKPSPMMNSGVQREKRRAGQNSKTEVKRTKYCETDGTVRQPGWAAKQLKNRRPVWIPQVSIPSPLVTSSTGGSGLKALAPDSTSPLPTSKRTVVDLSRDQVTRVFNGGSDFRNTGRRVRPINEANIPPGWLECPGLEGKWGVFLFSKTPLGERWNSVIPASKRLTPRIIVELAIRRNQPIGLVIDLTNSSIYYDSIEFEKLGVQYTKIRCCGHGATPTPQSVNEFWWRVLCFEKQRTGKFILVHCTHGFNRTGFMVAHFTMRWAERDTMNAIIRSFASRRPPGIYKDDYINGLLDYYHELRSSKVITPNTPAWKGMDSEEKEDVDSNQLTQASRVPLRATTDQKMTADDPVGERIHPEEQQWRQNEILDIMIGHRRSYQRFPGSQPVSMDRKNLNLLTKKRYWMSYKADGTRYMLLLTQHGAFVINREFEFQRVESRFPLAFKHDDVTNNPAIPHHMTLLDGEMVVDFDTESGTYTRKYLVYDLVFFEGSSWMNLPWKMRFAKLEEIVSLRNSEIKKIVNSQWPFHYQYQQEAFEVHVKLFRFLGQVEGILKMIPTLKHECDGLIFQGYDDKYLVGTDQELLKWKYAHLNSVDFRFRLNESSKFGGDAFVLAKGEVLLENVQIVFEKDSDRIQYNGKIVECSFDKEERVWKFLRERPDKKHPNGQSVYEKVVNSIRDNITQEELLGHILNTFKDSELYSKDREKLESLYANHSSSKETGS